MFEPTTASAQQAGAQEPAWPAILEEGDSILFIGGNLVGDEGGLHNHFRRTVRDARPAMDVETTGRVFFGTQLDQHDRPEAVEDIRSGEHDVIVFTSGSPADMQAFADMIREADATPVVILGWNEFPSEGEWGFEAMRAQLVETIEQVRALERGRDVAVSPAGLVLYDLMVNPPEVEGLRPDFVFRPGTQQQNDLGMMVNTAAMYAVLTGRSPVGLPVWEPFSPELVRAVQQRTWEIVQKWKAGEVEIKPVPAEAASEPAAGPTAQAQDEQAQEAPKWPGMLEEGDRLLFIGNSFIGAEAGLDNHFRRMIAQARPALTIENTSHIYWGTPLSRMYTDEATASIREGDYDLVVFTSGDEETMHRFVDLIRESGSEPVVHMTWARNPTINDGGLAAYREQTQQLVERMRAFEQETGVPVSPCGLIYYDLIVDPPEVEGVDGLRLDYVYIHENIHQNDLGTMVNAFSLYAVLTGRSPVGLPVWDPYPPELVRAVQERTWKIVQKWKAGEVELKPLRGTD